MKNFPQGIFQTLNWLVKQVDLLKYQVANPVTPPINGGSIAVDGVTIQGNGDIVPLSSNMQIEYIPYQGSNINIPTSKSFIYIYNDSGIAGSNIIFPSVTLGFRLIVINMSGFNLTPSDGTAPPNSPVVDIDGGQNNSDLGSSSLFEYIGTPDGWMLVRTMTI